MNRGAWQAIQSMVSPRVRDDLATKPHKPRWFLGVPLSPFGSSLSFTCLPRMTAPVGTRGCLDPKSLRQVGVRSLSPISPSEGDIIVASTELSLPISPWLNLHPCPLKEKGACGSRGGRGLHRPGLAGARLSSWFSSCPLCPSCLRAWTFQRPPARGILATPPPAPEPFQDGNAQSSPGDACCLLPQDDQAGLPPLLCPYPSPAALRRSPQED